MEATETTELGRRIALARRELGLTQRELADRIGVMLGIVEAYETGRADPSSHLDRIAQATGKDTIWFLPGSSDEMAAHLQRHASELAKREATLRQQEEELAGIRRQTEERLRKLAAFEGARDDSPRDHGSTDDAISVREAELALAERRHKDAEKELAERMAAFEIAEREFRQSRLRQAEDERQRQQEQSSLREGGGILAERELELERRRMELSRWVQTGDRVARELHHAFVTLEQLRHEASAERAAAVSGRAELELRALELARTTDEQQKRSGQLEAHAVELDRRMRELEEIRNQVEELEQTRADFAARDASLSERERELAEREEMNTARERELAETLSEMQQRALEQEQLERARAEPLADLARIHADLQNRERAVKQAEAEISEQAKALDERRARLEREHRTLEEGRAQAVERLTLVRENLRGAVLELQEQLAIHAPVAHKTESAARRPPGSRRDSKSQG